MFSDEQQNNIANELLKTGNANQTACRMGVRNWKQLVNEIINENNDFFFILN